MARSNKPKVAADDIALSRKRAQDELRQSETFNRTLFSSVGEGVVVYDRELRYVEWNPFMEELTGMPAEQVLGRRALELFPHLREQGVDRLLAQALLGETVHSADTPYHVPATGRTGWVVGVYGPHRSADGEILGVVGTIRDITGRRQAEDSLRESEERFRTLYENATIGLYRTTPDGSILLANPALARMLGMSSSDELLARNLEVDGFEPSYARREFMERVETQGEVRGLEAAWTRSDGTRVFVRESARAIRNSEGKTLFYDGTVEDITARRQAQEALEESELKYRQVVENASEAIFVAQNGRIVFLNSTTSTMIGHSSEVLLARPFADFIHPDDRDMVLERHRTRLRGEQPPSVYSFRIVREDGSTRWVELKAVAVDWQGGPATLNLLSDVTERRRAEMARERLLERQIVLNRVTLALGSLTDLAGVLRTLHAEVRTLLDANGFFVSRYHKDTGLITALFAVDEGGELDVSTFPPVPLAPEGKGMQSQVLRTGKPLYVPNWIEGERKMQTVHHIAPDGTFTPPPPEDERGECTQSALLVPMMSQGEPVGVLQVQSNRRNAYSDEDGDLLAGLANVAAISIQNALLVDEARRATAEVRQGLEGTIKAVALTTEMRDPYTAGHQERVARLACAIAREMGISEERVQGLRVVGLLHDVGKVSVPAEILSKPTALTSVEFSLVKGHAQTGYEILKGIVFPWPVAQIVLEHHERLDGSGYPRGLKGEEISLEARILAVADVVEAMASHRPYRPAVGMDAAVAVIRDGRGTLYDAAVADTCVALITKQGFRFET